MIHWNHDHPSIGYGWGEESWIHEGLATFGAFHAFGNSNLVCKKSIDWFEDYADVQLTWTEYSSDPVIEKSQYGSAYVLVLYIYEKYNGINTIRSILQDTDDGIKGFENHLGGITFSEVFKTWIIANYLDDKITDTHPQSNLYWYENVDIQIKPSQDKPLSPGELLSFSAYKVNLWAADYFKITPDPSIYNLLFEFDGEGGEVLSNFTDIQILLIKNNQLMGGPILGKLNYLNNVKFSLITNLYDYFCGCR